MEVQEFVLTYSEPIHRLAFSGSPFPGIKVNELIQQIEGRNKALKKLPTWFKTKGLFYPLKENLEQTSSEITANYKSGLVEGNTLADITGGFGIDSYYFAKNFKVVTHFEVNAALSEIAAHNFNQFGTSNINCLVEDGLNNVLSHSYSTIYADPSRRHASKGKVFFLKDCEPNIPEHLDAILDNCDVFLLKTSPMLDISAGLKELTNVVEIHIVAVNNEVKELLWLLKKGNKKPLCIRTVNVTAETNSRFNFDWDAQTVVKFSEPLTYLYEPNASIMKSGGMDHIVETFSLLKLHAHTHLFTSNDLIEFPGRRFQIEEVIPYSKQGMREVSALKKANISTRNFPLSVAELRQKWKLKDGGDLYLFFVTLNDNAKAILVCKKA